MLFPHQSQQGFGTGRVGGKSKRHTAGENLDPLPTLDNALAVRDTVARLIADVYTGRIPSRIAAGLASLMSLQLRAIETTNFELRVTELEKRVAEAEDKLNGHGGARASDVSQLRKPSPESLGEIGHGVGGGVRNLRIGCRTERYV
jgi:hypothetical protein